MLQIEWRTWGEQIAKASRGGNAANDGPLDHGFLIEGFGGTGFSRIEM